MPTKDRVKVAAVGGDSVTPFTLLTPIESYTSFDSGETRYTVVASTGEWQVGKGTVSGSSLSRGVVESNHLGNTDQIDFSGLTLQIAQSLTSDEWEEILLISHTHDNKAILDQIEQPFTTEDAAKLFSIEEGATQDQLAEEVPYTPNPTGNIPLAVDVDGALDALDTVINTHGHTAGKISYDPADDPIFTDTDLQSLNISRSNEAIVRATTVSGKINGLTLTQATSSSFQVEPGTARIVDAYTDPSTPVITSIEVETEFTVSVEYSGTDANITKVYLREDGTIFQSVDHNARNFARQYVLLGLIYTLGGIIIEIRNAANVVQQTASAVHDVTTELARFTSGSLIYPTNALLNIWISAGRYVYPNINLDFDITQPSEYDTLQLGSTSGGAGFVTFNRAGILDTTQLLDIPKFYNDTGVNLIALGAGEAVIHRLYSIGLESRQLCLLYGQFVYSGGAKQAAGAIGQDDRNLLLPDAIKNMTFLGYICVSAEAADFSNNAQAWISSGVNQIPTSAGSDPYDVEPYWMAWRGVWSQQSYLKHDVVYDSGWTMIANKDTSDRAAPRPTGDPRYVFNGVLSPLVVPDVKQVIFGTRYTWDQNGYVNGYRVNTVAGLHYYVYMVRNPMTNPVSEPLGDFIAVNTGWEEFNTNQVLMSPGTVFDVVVIVNEPNPAVSVDWSGNWVYDTPNNAGVPATGEVVQGNNSPGLVTIHKTDNDGNTEADRPVGEKLADLTVGDIFEIPGATWAIQSIVDNGAYFTFGISPAIQDDAEGVQVFTFHSTSVVDISIGINSNFWSGNANVQGLYGTDLPYEDIVANETAYGVDLRVQEAIISEDWDLVSATGTTVAEGGGGEIGDVAWGVITGELTNQIDLATELSNKEPLIIKSTGFNKDFGASTDTVCQGNDPRLSDARPPTAHDHDSLYSPLGHLLGSHGDVDTTNAEEGDSLTYNETAGQWEAKQSQGSETGISYKYAMELPSNSAPASGEASRDNDDTSLVTELFVNGLDALGASVDMYWSDIKEGDQFVYVNNADDSIFEMYTATGAATKSVGVWTIPVTFTSEGSTPLADADVIRFVWRATNQIFEDHINDTGLHVPADGELTPTRFLASTDTEDLHEWRKAVTEYSDKAYYAINDICIYMGFLYTCNTDITVPEVFDANKWDSAVNPIGSGTQLSYRWDDSTTGDPGQGRVAIDTADPALLTTLRVNKTTQLGNLVDFIWIASQVGDMIGFEENHGDMASVYVQVNGALVDQETYFDIPVTYLAHAANLTDNIAGIVSILIDPKNKLPAGGTVKQVLAKASSTNYDAEWIDSPGMKIVTDNVPPTSPLSGQEWFNSDSGISYTWYVDSDGGQWIQS